MKRELQRAAKDKNYSAVKLRKMCEFKIGDKVQINKKVRDTFDKDKTVTEKMKGTVIGRYPNSLLVENSKGIRECFTYTDIKLNGAITAL